MSGMNRRPMLSNRYRYKMKIPDNHGHSEIKYVLDAFLENSYDHPNPLFATEPTRPGEWTYGPHTRTLWTSDPEIVKAVVLRFIASVFTHEDVPETPVSTDQL